MTEQVKIMPRQTVLVLVPTPYELISSSAQSGLTRGALLLAKASSLSFEAGCVFTIPATTDSA